MGAPCVASAVAAIAIAALLTMSAAPAKAQPADPAIRIGASDFGGVVAGPNGPEAGVWVIAETNDLATKFAKIVVTDDRGRYVIPELPKATYSLWVRGYGLVDSPKRQSAPGNLVDLTAVPAPSAAAAAEYYPGMYWYAMLRIPPASQFPGTGDQGNGIAEVMKTQHYWIDTLKNSCQSCHALGSKGVRTLSKDLGTFANSTDTWTRRVASGQAMSNMALTLSRFGASKALSLFADWTDRIAAGELPFATPARPQGIERSVSTISTTRSRPTSATRRSMPTARSTARPRRAPTSCRSSIRSTTRPTRSGIPIAIPRLPRRWTCRPARRSIGAMRRSGTAIPASTTRSWTSTAGSGSPRASGPPPIRTSARRARTIPRRRSRR